MRSRFIFAGEIDAAIKISGTPLPENPNERRRREYELAVNQRWKRLVSATSELEAELVEAEVLWGTELKREGHALRELVLKLGNALEEHLEITRDSVSPLPDSPEAAKKRNAIIWRSVGEDATDEYKYAVASSIGQIEAKLLPKLQRGR